MEKLINIGVLGCSSFAKRSILPALKNLPGNFSLQGIASRNKESANEFAGLFDTTPYDYDSLIDNKLIDAVYIPLPNSLHAEWINKALDKGKHVLVEKSMATSLADTTALNNKALSNSLVLVENFQFRFHRQLAKIMEIINSGSIGELRSMRSSFGFPPFADKSNIRYQKELGGGALLDVGAYPIKISQLFMGNDLRIKAARLNYDSPEGVDMGGGGFIEQVNGPLFSEVAFGFDHYYQCNVEFWGSKGKLTATRIFTAHPEFEPELILETGGASETIKVKPDNHFVNMLLHFHGLICQPDLAADEYAQNINQSRLIEEFKNKSNE